jgi:hypothetical protein
MTATLAAPVVACPAWCVLRPGHEDGCDIDGSRFIRHRVAFGDVEVEETVVVEPDGAVDVEPLVVWLGGRQFTFTQAQQLVVELTRALTTAGGK